MQSCYCSLGGHEITINGQQYYCILFISILLLQSKALKQKISYFTPEQIKHLKYAFLYQKDVLFFH